MDFCFPEGPFVPVFPDLQRGLLSKTAVAQEVLR